MAATSGGSAEFRSIVGADADDMAAEGNARYEKKKATRARRTSYVAAVCVGQSRFASISFSLYIYIHTNIYIYIYIYIYI